MRRSENREEYVPIISFEPNAKGIKKLIDNDFASIQAMKRRFLDATKVEEDREERTIIILQTHSSLMERVNGLEKSINELLNSALEKEEINEEQFFEIKEYFVFKKQAYIQIWNQEVGISNPEQLVTKEKPKMVKKLEEEIAKEIEQKYNTNKKLIKIMCSEILRLVENIYGQDANTEEKQWVDKQVTFANYYLNNEPENYEQTKDILTELTENNYLLQQIYNQKQRETASIFSSNSNGIYRLINKRLGDEGIERLSKLFDVPFIRDEVQSLVLSKNGIGGTGCIAIASILRRCQNITKLAIEQNPLTNEGAKALSNEIATHSSLKELYLSNCTIGANGFQEIAQMIRVNTVLEKLALNHINMGDEGAAILANGLKDNQHISYIDINEAKITDSGIRSLAPSLINREYLDLGYNSLTGDSIKSLYEAAKGYETINIKQLKLGGMKINESPKRGLLGRLFYGNQQNGASLLSEILGKAKDLLLLDLNQNEIGDEGIIEIVQSLKSCTSLRVLRLGNNKITDQGAREILNTVKHLPYLERVEVYENTISDNLNKEITGALRHNQLNLETFRSIASVAKTLAPISQLIRNGVTLNNHELQNLPVEIIFNIIKFLPHTQILQTETLSNLLESFIKDRGLRIKVRDQLVQSDSQQRFIDRIGKERFGEGFSISK